MRQFRSMLFAPAVRPDMFAKLPQRGADAVILDLEDAVPVDRKDDARAAVAAAAPGLIEAGCTVFVRVNGADTPWMTADVAEAVVAGVTAILLPKVESAEAPDALAGVLRDDVKVVAGIETALGVADARTVLAHARVDAAYFGAEDLIADMGGVRTESNAEVAYARSHVALAGRLAEIALYDQVTTRFDDDARFSREATEARNLGYVGKMCIHPRQVALANAAFSPSPAEVARARRLVAAYAHGVARGLAAIDFEGDMVDEPLATQARRLLEVAAVHGIDGEAEEAGAEGGVEGVADEAEVEAR